MGPKWTCATSASCEAETPTPLILERDGAPMALIVCVGSSTGGDFLVESGGLLPNHGYQGRGPEGWSQCALGCHWNAACCMLVVPRPSIRGHTSQKCPPS